LPPFVVALVGAGGEEFVYQIPFGAHYFDAIVARFTRQRRTAGEIVNQRQDLVMAECVRRETVNGSLNGRWRNQIRLIAIAPGMQDLQGNFATFFVNRIGHNAVMRQLAGIVQHCATFHPHP
jgi:hypothetical protein